MHCEVAIRPHYNIHEHSDSIYGHIRSATSSRNFDFAIRLAITLGARMTYMKVGIPKFILIPNMAASVRGMCTLPTAQLDRF